jgi:hypothetical protein
VVEYLGVGGGLENGAMTDQVLAQQARVGQVAVMGDRHAAELELREQRLDIAKHQLAGGRIAGMSDRGGSAQPPDNVAVREDVADQAQPAMGVELSPVEGDDAGGLLAAMLQRMQPQRHMGRGIDMAVDTEDRAFLAQMVVVEGIGGGYHGGVSLCGVHRLTDCSR